MVLFIDTSDNKQVTVALRINGKNIHFSQLLDRQKAQVVLPLLEKLLHDTGHKLKDITAIQVSPGPGSFTGLRVGVAIANTLGFLLQIPVNDHPIGESVLPQYS